MNDKSNGWAKPRTLTGTLSLLLILLDTAIVHADEVVIVSSRNPTVSMSREQVSNIFLGKLNSFPDGGQATPVDLPEDNEARQGFYAKVMGKSSSQVKAYWARLSFTGKGMPPREFPGSREVKAAVANNPSLIGYIEKSAVDASVKVIFEAR